jgi:hypothetical protein
MEKTTTENESEKAGEDDDEKQDNTVATRTGGNTYTVQYLYCRSGPVLGSLDAACTLRLQPECGGGWIPRTKAQRLLLKRSKRSKRLHCRNGRKGHFPDILSCLPSRLRALARLPSTTHSSNFQLPASNLFRAPPGHVGHWHTAREHTQNTVDSRLTWTKGPAQIPARLLIACAGPNRPDGTCIAVTETHRGLNRRFTDPSSAATPIVLMHVIDSPTQLHATTRYEVCHDPFGRPDVGIMLPSHRLV